MPASWSVSSAAAGPTSGSSRSRSSCSVEHWRLRRADDRWPTRMEDERVAGPGPRSVRGGGTVGQGRDGGRRLGARSPAAANPRKASASQLYDVTERGRSPRGSGARRASAAATRPRSPSCTRARPCSISARAAASTCCCPPSASVRPGTCLRPRHDRRDARRSPRERAQGRGDERRVPEGSTSRTIPLPDASVDVSSRTA